MKQSYGLRGLKMNMLFGGVAFEEFGTSSSSFSDFEASGSLLLAVK